MDHDTLRWFSRGFMMAALVLLLAALVFTPILGHAQGGGEEQALRELAGEPSRLLRTDDPLGRNLVPVAQPGELSMADERALAGRLALSRSGSDDPSGRLPQAVPGLTGLTPADEKELAARMPASRAGSDAPGAPGAPGDIRGQAYASPLVVPASDFAYAGWGNTYAFNYSGGYVHGGYGCGMAPLYLPDGVSVTEVWASLYDNAAGDAATARIYIYRTDNWTGVGQLMASVSTSGQVASTFIRIMYDDTISFAPVVYPNYSHYAFGCMDTSETRIYSLRVYYE